MGSTEHNYTPNVTREGVLAKQHKEEQRAEARYTEYLNSQREKEDQINVLYSNITSFVTFRAPLILFILGVCLMVPSMIRSIVSACSPFNLDQTLSAAAEAQNLDSRNRREHFQELSASIATAVKRSSRSASFLYLAFKVIMLTVILVELVYVNKSVLAEIDNHKQEADSMLSLSRQNQSDFISRKSTDDIVSSANLDKLTGYDGRPLLCEFEITSIHNTYQYTVQCIFSQKKPLDFSLNNAPIDTRTEKDTAVDERTGNNFQDVDQNKLPVFLNILEAVFTAVMAYLVVLAVGNVFSLASWVWRLVLGQCRSKSMPMDALLLMLLSRDNTSPLVTQQLTQNLPWGAEGGPGNSMRLQEKTLPDAEEP